MRIRTLLTTALTASLLMTIGLLFAIWNVGSHLERLALTQQRALEVVSEVSSLLLLTNEYALHAEERVVQQWSSSHKRVIQILSSSLESDASTPAVALEKAKALSQFFNPLTETAEGADQNLQSRRTRLLFGQLLTHTQSLFDTVNRWADTASTERLALEQRFHMLSIAVPIIMLLVLAVLVTLLVLRVLRPLFVLHKNVQAFAKGDLSVRCATNAKDEMGDLARTFDAMASSRQVIEAELRESTAVAQAANLAKSSFLANMSHEIRTPMNGILGMLQLLQHTELTSRQIDYTRKAEGATQALLGIINDILDFSKVEAGKLELDNQALVIGELLRELSVILSANLGNKNVEVLFLIAADVPPVVIGDALRLRQILINLAGNALKFTEQGEVVLGIRMLKREADQVELEFSIRDTGIGIPADKLGYIFEGFSQAESTTSRRFGGTGLGLAISQRLVALMGGTLAVESEFGKGSRFFSTYAWVWAPLWPPRSPVHRLIQPEPVICKHCLFRVGRACAY